MLGSRVLLIVGGGIAAFKIPELIRMLRREGIAVVPVLTKGGAEFVTPLTLSALSESPCHSDLFDLTRESEMGHIQLSRAADLVVVAPATADLMAKMAAGLADDLASTLLLATDKPVLAAPAMNVRMWQHPATQRNRDTLEEDGIRFVGPDQGDMACGEYGPGRMAEPEAIRERILAMLGRDRPLRLSPETAVALPAEPPVPAIGPLTGRHVLVTSGPTHEPIDPVRYIANRSSGAQGTAIAAALRDLGARVSFVTGPAEIPPPAGVDVIRVQTAREMRDAVEAALPADAAVMAAAVADFRPAEIAESKIKKTDDDNDAPTIVLTRNPDILRGLVQARDDSGREQLIVGFAAETGDAQTDPLEFGRAKLIRKGCDLLCVNQVGTDLVFGQDTTRVTILEAPVQGRAAPDETVDGTKAEVAAALARRIAQRVGRAD